MADSMSSSSGSNSNKKYKLEGLIISGFTFFSDFVNVNSEGEPNEDKVFMKKGFIFVYILDLGSRYLDGRKEECFVYL